MLRLVLDTSTIVSGLLWRGNEFELLKKLEDGKADMFISPEILVELNKVLHYDRLNGLIAKSNLRVKELLQKIISMANLVIGPKLNILVCRDVEDNKIIECAVNSKADFIVSGDEDLLIIREFEGIQIVATSQMLEKLNN